MPGGRGNVGSTHWFEDAFGFQEKSYDETRRQFEVADGVLRSKANGARFHVGAFEVLSVEELQARLEGGTFGTEGGLTFRNIVGSAKSLHQDAANAGAVFQVASQFNCLEMNEPGARPEHGVTRYAVDATQGPACALACPAATVYRNYLVNGRGQGGGHQVDCLSRVGDLVQNDKEKHWRMLNGYCLPVATGSIARLSKRLEGDPALVDAIRSQMQVGVHWDTQVGGHGHRVCQVFCSALPVAYAKHERASNWMPFACAVLDAAFEGTLAVAAVLAAQRRERVKVYLTAVGGGAFGNRSMWIVAAMQRALNAYAASPLDVRLVHFATIPRGAYKTLEQGRNTSARRPSPPPTRSAPDTPGLPVAGTSDVATADAGKLPSPGERLTAAFACLDANGDGVVDREELLHVLQSINSTVFTEEAVDTIMRASDADADGQIHYAEFAAWVCKEDPAVTSGMLEMLGTHAASSSAGRPEGSGVATEPRTL